MFFITYVIVCICFLALGFLFGWVAGGTSRIKTKEYIDKYKKNLFTPHLVYDELYGSDMSFHIYKDIINKVYNDAFGEGLVIGIMHNHDLNVIRYDNEEN